MFNPAGKLLDLHIMSGLVIFWSLIFLWPSTKNKFFLVRLPAQVERCIKRRWLMSLFDFPTDPWCERNSPNSCVLDIFQIWSYLNKLSAQCHSWWQPDSPRIHTDCWPTPNYPASPGCTLGLLVKHLGIFKSLQTPETFNIKVTLWVSSTQF